MTGRHPTPAPAIAAQDLIDRGDAAGALALLDQAGGAQDADIFAARASAYLALDQAEAALAAAGAALRRDRAHPAAAFNEGRALMLLGEPERAAASFAAAERAFPQVAEIAARLGEAAYLAGDLEAAEAALRRALARAPGHPAAFPLLAELLSQGAIPTGLENFLAGAARQGGAPAFRAASALARLGRRREALALLDRIEAAAGPAAAIDMLAADLWREEGDISRAMTRARAAAARAPGDAEAHAPLARLLLMTGAARKAEALARVRLAAAPHHQLWLAFLWAALASQGAGAADDLLSFERDIAVFDPGCPPGFSSLAAFNAALAAELAPLHRAAGAPLGQSVLEGSQTRRPLQSLRSPAMVAFFAAIRRIVADFAARLPDAPDHPFHGRRAARRRITGAWSVALAPGGRHVAHVHPGGWISSAYYVETPAGADDGAGAGCLAFGAPPFAAPGLETPRLVLSPRPGRLVLFPSYCWHGTIPFAAPGRRLTIAFDVAAG